MAKMKDGFDSLPWHDSELTGVSFDRSAPGEKDIIVLSIRWYDDKISNVVFKDAFRAQLEFNCGIKCGEHGEPIDYAISGFGTEEEMENFYKTRNIGFENPSLCYYEIVFSSTGSRIRIISSGYYLEST